MQNMKMLALVGLLLCGANNVGAMGQDPKEILYACYEVGQDFASVPVIVSNIDLFVGFMNISIGRTQLQLKEADQEFKAALYRSAMLLGASSAAVMMLAKGKSFVNDHVVDHIGNFVYKQTKKQFNTTDIYYNGWRPACSFVGDVVNACIRGAHVASSAFVGLNLYDTWKTRSNLTKTFALDKEILAQLMQVKDSMVVDYSTVDRWEEPAIQLVAAESTTDELVI